MRSDFAFTQRLDKAAGVVASIGPQGSAAAQRGFLGPSPGPRCAQRCRSPR
jgi:hypothetical protein